MLNKYPSMYIVYGLINQYLTITKNTLLCLFFYFGFLGRNNMSPMFPKIAQSLYCIYYIKTVDWTKT